eukprot:144699_1
MAETAEVGESWLFGINESTLTCDRFWATFGMIFQFTTLAYIIWRNNQSATRDHEVKLDNLLWTVTKLAIIVFGINQLSSMTMAFPWVYDVGCMTLSIINTWLYFGSKWFLWLYSIIRLYDVFDNSAMSYNVNLLKGLVIFFAFEVVIINILHILFDDAVKYKGLCV